MVLTWFDELWGEVFEKYQPGVLEFVVLILVQTCAFWVPATIYLSIDLLFPNFSHKHKLQSERRQPSWDQIRHCIWFVGVNEILGVAIQVAVRSVIGWDKTLYSVTRELPALSTVVIDFFYGMTAREISFYYIHRTFHHPSIYAYVHKKHHQFTAPMAFAAQYAHPVEHIFANVMPIVLPLALRRANLLSAAVFASFELWEAAADHSGYDFPKLPSAKIHDLHHEKFRVNYSTLGIMDWLYGTDIVGWDKPKPKAA